MVTERRRRIRDPKTLAGPTAIVLASMLGGPAALAQAPDGPVETFDEPVETFDEPALPALPPPNADFKRDQALFENVETAPEQLIAADERAQTEELRVSTLAYQEAPELAYTTQAIAGILGAGLVGLAGGAIGEAIAPGDETQPLGGFRGPVIGGFVGAAVGTGLGVWGGGLLFDKETHPGWIALGTAAGTVVGSGAALGIAALGSDDTLTATASVASLMLFQVGGAILFGELFLPPPASVDAKPEMIPVLDDASVN